MLKLYNKEHEAISALTNLKDYKVEYTLSGEDLLEFSLSICDENIHLVEEEGYVRNKNNEYVIKAIEYSDNFKRFTCDVNVEDLVGKAISSFDTSNNNINDTIRLAIAGTGWILADNNITKRRTVRLTNTNALEVLREVRKVFSVDFRYDAINKIIHVYEKFGEDRGVYFSDELNLKSFSIPSDTYDYVTRLYPYGKDGLNISSINNGKEYIENFQYSNKVIELIWEDNRYTVAENLLEDAKAKLDELSKPKRSYQASIVDLAKQSEEYSYLDFFLGDTITLLSKQDKFRDKQRIVKYVEYPDDSSQNTCELGNTTLTFEDLQKENEAKNNTVDAITSDNGTVDGSKVDSITTEQISDFEAEVAKITDLTVVNAEIENLKAQDVTITGKLSAVEGEFGTLKANVGVIDKLTVTHTAQINNLEANKADITDLNAVKGEITLLESEVAKIGTLEADVADIEHVLAGNITSDNIASGTITADKMATGTITAGSGVIANGAIGNAQISSLSANKIDTGEIDTSKVKVKGKDGFLLIENNTLYVTDNNRQIRVELGQIENNTNYGFIVRGADGQTVLLDHNGVRNAGITDGAIDNRTVSESANISGKKLDIDSVIKTINEDGSVKIQGTIVQVGNTTLDVKLSEQNNLITEQGKKLETQQAEITANTNAIKLKVDNQTYQTDKTNMTSQLNKNTSEISTMKGQIALKVEQTDITNAINNVQIGGRNLVKNTKEEATFTITSTSLNTWTYSDVSKILGQQITVSFEAKSSNGTNQIYVSLANNNYTIYKITGGNITLPSTYKKFVYTFTAPNNTSINTFMVVHGKNYTSSSNSGTVSIKNIKLELGNKPTDWTPAPEDVTSEIENKVSTAKAEIKVTTDSISQNVSNLSQTVSTKADSSTVTTINNKVGTLETSVNGISGKVSNLETTTTTLGGKVNTVQSTANANKGNITNLQGEVSTIKSNVASLEVTTSGISQKVSNVESTTASLTTQVGTANTNATNALNKANAVDGKVTTLQGEYNTTKSKVASLDVNLSGITQRVSSTESKLTTTTNKIDNLQIGGRNLILDSKKVTENSGYFIKTFTIADTTTMVQGNTYTISFDGMLSDSSQTGFYVNVYPSPYPTLITLNRKGNASEYHHYTGTFTLPYNSSYTHIGIYTLPLGNYKLGGVKNVKVEKGNKPTDYTPAPEDVDSSIASVDSKVQTTNNKVASIETNLNGITQRVSSTESTVSSHTTQLGTVDNRINTAKNSAISTASSDATTKANNALASAKTDATTKANNALADAKTYTNGQITTVNQTINNKVAEIKTTTDAITQRVQSTESTTSTLTTKVNTAQSTANTANSTANTNKSNLATLTTTVSNTNSKVATLETNLSNITSRVSATETNLNTTTSLAKAMSGGKIVHNDPTFKQGTNNVNVYNNSANGTVTVTRISKVSDCPTTSTHCIEVKTTGTASPGNGGFYQGIQSRANAIFIQKILAKVPTGCKLNTASNSMGNGYSDRWLTSNKGTGKWEEYIREVRCGSTGTFSGGGHVYVSGASPTTSSPLIWYVGSCTVYDITDSDDRITNLTTRMNTAEQKITDTAITNTVKKNFYTKSETEGAITSKGYQTSSQVQQKVDSFEVKIGSSGGYNELLNSNFNAKLLNWVVHNSASVNFSPSGLSNTFGKVIAITGGATNSTSGIFQRFNTIVGKTYTCSFYAEPHNIANVPTLIGIEGVKTINIAYNSFRRYSFTFKATSTSHTFVAYTTLKNGVFYLGRPMVSSGEILYEYSPNPNEVLSTTAQFTVDGMTISSAKAGVKTNISTDGMNITRTSDGKSLLKATSKGVRAEGGMFYVEDNQNGYTYFWGRDIVINDQRALVGTNSTPESSLLPHKLYVNYNNDFKNGVEIGGSLTNGGRPVLSEAHFSGTDSGILTLSNGFIIQWGKIGNLTIQGGEILSHNLTFPIAFNNKCFFASVNVNSVDNGSGDLETRYTTWLKHIDKNGAVIKSRNYTDQKWGSKMEIYWFAIGS